MLGVWDPHSVIDAIAGWPRRRLLALVTLARRHGVDEAALLEGTGLTVVDLADPHHELTHGHEYAVIRNLLARTDPTSPLALEAGLDFHLSTVPAWGEAMRTSRTLGEAIAFSMRYSQAIPSTVAFSAEFEGDQIHLTYAADDVPADVAEFVVLRTMVSTSMTSRELLGRRVPLTSVASAFPKPAFAAAFEDFYGVGVAWDAPASGVTIAARWLQAPLPGADDEAHRRAADQCRLDPPAALVAGRPRRAGAGAPRRPPLAGRDAAAARGRPRRLRAQPAPAPGDRGHELPRAARGVAAAGRGRPAAGRDERGGGLGADGLLRAVGVQPRVQALVGPVAGELAPGPGGRLTGRGRTHVDGRRAGSPRRGGEPALRFVATSGGCHLPRPGVAVTS